MEKRTLGRTGFEATVLGFGAMEIRGPRIWNGCELTDEGAERILHATLDAGINLIDTSWDYGRSEECVKPAAEDQAESVHLSDRHTLAALWGS